MKFCLHHWIHQYLYHSQTSHLLYYNYNKKQTAYFNDNYNNKLEGARKSAYLRQVK